MLMTICKRLVAAAAAAAAVATVLVLLPSGAGAEDAARAPIRSCGDLDPQNGLLIADVSARRVSCRRARLVARNVPARCEATGSCRSHRFTCLAARATEELRFARCTKAREGDELYKTVRFDYGS